MALNTRSATHYRLGEPPRREILQPVAAITEIRLTRLEQGARRDAVVEAVVGDTVQRLEDLIPGGRIVWHSPDGFEWGYGGSGTADLALNILALVTNEKEAARLHQSFKAEMVATMPSDGGRIPIADVEKWLDALYARETADSEAMREEHWQRLNNRLIELYDEAERLPDGSERALELLREAAGLEELQRGFDSNSDAPPAPIPAEATLVMRYRGIEG